MTTLLLGTVGVGLAPGDVGVAHAQLVAPWADETRRSYFLGLEDLSDWTRSAGAQPREVVLTSPPLLPPLAWNELVVSWNAALPAGAYLRVEARALHAADEDEPAKSTKFYVLGQWSVDPARQVRESLKEQSDADGDVDTDTLVLKRQGGQVQLRLTVGADDKVDSAPADLAKLIRFVGLSFVDSTVEVEPREPNRAAWGKTVAVPARFQMDFKELGGAVWCSPTSVSMILAHWSTQLGREELTMTVPEAAQAVHDPKWPGTGNWVFNTAFAGSFPGVRAYVARFNDLTDLEAWIAAGVPVALSVNYGLLKGEGRKGGGHLVVCNGFTANGDVVIADPGRKPLEGETYRVFPRADVAAGWGASKNTVYLIYPEEWEVPGGSGGRWYGG